MRYIFRQSQKQGFDDWGSLSIVDIPNKEHHQIATRIFITRKDWDKYCSGHYLPSGVMKSLDIKFGLFSTLLSQILSLLENETELAKVNQIIENAHDAIKTYQNSKAKAGRKKKSDILFFTDYMSIYVDEMRAGERLVPQTSQKYSKRHIRSSASMLNIIKRYEEQTGHRLTFEDITMNFQKAFISWNKEREVKHNTILNYLHFIRNIMRSAYESKLTKNRDFMIRGFVPVAEEADSIFLTPKQIQELSDLDVSTRDKLKAVIKCCDMDEDKKKHLLRYVQYKTSIALTESRDLFLVGYYTGQRYSDYSRISKDMIIEYGGRQMLSFVQKKTGIKVTLPLDKRILPILNRYGGKVPKIEYSCFVDRLKQLGELLNWTWRPDFDSDEEGVYDNVRFCDLISSHTARRSFATNAYAAGVPIESIMAVTGHTTEERLKTYIRLQSREKGMMAAKAFSGYIVNYKQ